MDVNRFLPVLLPSVAALVVFGVVGLVALSWTTSSEARLWIRRALLILLLVTVGGPLLFWFVTWGVESTPRHAIDRSLQQRQQEELNKRVKEGGH